MIMTKQLMIGDRALMKLGSSRHPVDTVYLIDDKFSDLGFLYDKVADVNYCNANGNEFFNAVWKAESRNIGPLASPQALLELEAYYFHSYSMDGNWAKADDTEYNIKFLMRQYNLSELKIVNEYIAEGSLSEVNRIIKSVRR